MRRMDVASIGRRLGIARPDVLEMLAAIRNAQILADRAEELRPKVVAPLSKRELRLRFEKAA